MSKKDDFKTFVASKPNLASYVKDGSMTWQKFYELYDLYGENNSVWDDYSLTRNNSTVKINDLIKNGYSKRDAIKEIAEEYNISKNKCEDKYTVNGLLVVTLLY